MSLSFTIGTYSFCFGAIVASFLNVVIWRVPRGESIVRPASHCPKCNAPIRWFQNIPILSWLALRGKCANCREPISPRYILIEILGGCLFLAAFLAFGLSLYTAMIWLWISLMIVGSMIDCDLKLLPDFVTIGGMILGVAFNLLCSLLEFFTSGFSLELLLASPITVSLIGLLVGFGLLWLVRFFGGIAFKREAMGMGDVLLMGAVGAISGPAAVLFTLIASSLLGSVVGVGMIAMAKTRLGKFAEIPFGPYICVAHLLYCFFGPELIGWYAAFFK